MSSLEEAGRLFEKAKNDLSIDIFYECIAEYNKFVSSVSLLDYLLIDASPSVSKVVILRALESMGIAYKYIFELMSHSKLKSTRIKTVVYSGSITVEELEVFENSLKCFRTILDLSVDNKSALQEIASLYSIKSLLQQYDYQECLRNGHQSLLYDPLNSTTHYNVGFINLKLNKLNEALYHYKLAVKLSEPNSRIIINSYYGITCVYKSVQKWSQALYYLLKAKQISALDPDINNQLGVVYTELRRTDLADKCYNIAEQNYKSTVVSTDSTFLLAEIYLNHGHMFSYNGKTEKSIEYYNKSLEVHPNFLLPFQNKIMNLNYLFTEFSDKDYIYRQHKLVEKLIPSVTTVIPKWGNVRKRVGLVSGDFVDHPVYYFIACLLGGNLEFDVYCYSEKVLTTKSDNVVSRIIKNVSDDALKEMVLNDRIDVLFDLSGHTAMNRMGLFAKRAAPVQMTYVGYPNTTGLKNMDYRITDKYADECGYIPDRYTEELLYLDRCFLCYTPTLLELGDQPYLRNGRRVTFGSFNRMNKINKTVRLVWEKLLRGVPNSRIVVKTKALLNKRCKQEFLDLFDKFIVDRIDIIDCTVTHDKHLLKYNDVDICIDTFPYSGTTTSCEALSMGVPVLTLRDNENYFHAQNVTSSILHYSKMDEYICETLDDFVSKSCEFLQWDDSRWKNLKGDTRKRFVGGNVCDTKNFIKEFTRVIQTVG